MTVKEIINLSNQTTNLDKRLKSASIQASKYFESHNIRHAFFEKESEMQLTPELCERIYYDMVEKCLKDNLYSLYEYGLLVRLIPIKSNEVLVPWFDFGIIFVSDQGQGDLDV